MKELDLLLNRYLETRYLDAPQAERYAFAALLDLPDPVLFGRLTGREPPTNEDQRRVIEVLRRTPGT